MLDSSAGDISLSDLTPETPSSTDQNLELAMAQTLGFDRKVCSSHSTSSSSS